MKSDKLHIEKNTTQETLVIPLYARKLSTELYPSIYKDPAAMELMNRLDYDFDAAFKKSSGLVRRFGALEIAMRQVDLSIEVKEYLRDHPRAAVVNMGCGLDQTGENCDNGTCHIYNLDLPDVIRIREELIPTRERVTNIPCDLNDPSWFQQINDANGAVFFAAGVFYFFETEEMQKLINRMAGRFHRGKLVFDSVGKIGLKFTLRTVQKQAGIQQVGTHFYVRSLRRDVEPWLEHAKASSKGYMFGYHDLIDPSIPGFFRLVSKFGDECMKMRILRMDFE